MTNAFGGLILAGLIVANPSLATGQDSLALKRLTLSSGGVGYFEYETTIDGNTQILLPGGLDQVDDVLKSLVIRDTKGNAATLRLAGRKPLGQIIRQLAHRAGCPGIALQETWECGFTTRVGAGPVRFKLIPLYSLGKPSYP